MRPAHIRLVAAGGVLAVVLGITTAFVVARDDPAQPTAAPTPTTIATNPVADDRTDTKDRTDPTSAPTTRPPVRDEQAAAKAAAVAFLRELGMLDPVAATYRRTGAVTAEVGIHPRAGKGGRLLDQLTTQVALHRYANGWVATGAQAVNTIEVFDPLPFTRIQSPVTVSGESTAYEGTVHVTVTEDRRGADRVLGKGFVNGGAAELAPFSGPIQFTRPYGDAGWVVFTPDSGADLGIFSVTAVRVRFVNSDHQPQILGVTTSPAAIGSSRQVTLTGDGVFTVRVRAFAADEVRVLLVPSGTGARAHTWLLGVDTSAEDGERWSVSWRYPDQGFNGHLLIQVSGRGGTVEHDGIAVLHP
jgi:Immunoglobulin-like domain of bacterial spore germination